MRANYNKTPSSRTSLKIQCRYTSQLTRKKKIWQDGFVKVFPSGNSFIVQLFDINDLRDQSLEGRLMTPKEAEHFKRKALTEMTLSNHMIEFNFDSEPAPYAPPVKVAKFKPPSVISRPPQEPVRDESFEQYYSNNSNSSNFSNNQTQNRSYSSKFSGEQNGKRSQFAGNDSEDRDLDELWGNESQKEHESELQNRVAKSSSQEPAITNSLNSRVEQQRYNDFEVNEQKSPYNGQESSLESRKRPCSEISKSNNNDSEQFQRRPQPPPDATMNALVRGSMRRVDQSIWDD